MISKEYEFESVVREDDENLLSLKNAFLASDDKEAAGETYLDDMDEYVVKNVPELIREGNLEKAWNLVIQAYSQLTDFDIENYDDNEMHESCKKWMGEVLSRVEGYDERRKVLHLLIWIEGCEDFPCWVRSASADLVHDLFHEPGFLEEIAAWYESKYDADPVENGALWKGKLRDVYERLDSEDWKKVYDEMTEADPVFTDLVYAECIARRRDPRCLEIWDRIEAELEKEDDEVDASIIYSILWARYDWYDLNGPEEEAVKAADELNRFIDLLHDEECGDECCCGHHHDDEDECGCGHHHHHDEDHECHCGHHHDDEEEHECHCGHHHHHDEDHECCCGNKH